jgi:hypothetical protein
MNARATYGLSERKFEGANVAPVNCEDNPGHEFCQNLCTWIDEGQCSVSGLPCKMTSQCATGQTCQGRRVVGDACRNSADCGGFDCLPPTGILAAYADDIKSNDGNVILKVTRDRECATWLEKSQCSSVKDQNTGERVQQCSGLVSCSKHEPNSSGFTCTKEKDSIAFPFVDWWYTLRDISWNGVEVDGYSVLGRVFPDIIDPVNIVPGWCQDANGAVFPHGSVTELGCYNDGDCAGRYGATATCGTSRQGICTERFQNTYLIGCDTNNDCNDTSPSLGFCDTSDATTTHVGVRKMLPLGQTCAAHTSCGDPFLGGPACIHGECWWNIYGGFFDVQAEQNKIQCREFPEASAPFKNSVVAAWKGSPPDASYPPLELKGDFKGANTCVIGQACQCAYNRADYGSPSAARFFTASSALSAPDGRKGVCSGGTFDKAFCDPNLAGTCGEEGSCKAVSTITHAIGKQGFCFDPDYSRSINGNAGEFGCTLWLPIDHLDGTADIYNQHPEAGFQSPDGRQNYLYCTEAEGNTVNGGYSPVVYEDQGFVSSNNACLPFSDRLYLGPNSLWGDYCGVNEGAYGERALASTIPKAGIIAIAVEFKGESNVGKDGKRTTFWLDDGNNWMQGQKAPDNKDGFHDDVGDPGAQVYTTGGTAGWGPCKRDYNSDGEIEDHCNNTACVSVEAAFNSSGQLTGFNGRLCDDNGGSRQLYPWVDIKVYLREQCSEFLHAYQDGTTKVATDTMWRYQTGQWAFGNNPNYLYSHETTSLVPEPTLVPFGTMSFTGSVGNTMNTPLTGKIPVATDAEGPNDIGSPFTTSAGAALPTFAPMSASDGQAVVAGYPFSCAGPCLSLAIDSNRGITAAADGRSLFKDLFVTTVGSYRWNDSTLKYEPVVDDPDAESHPSWDRTEKLTSDPQKVQVDMLDPARCTTESCDEYDRSKGITVNDEYLPGSVVCGDGGSLNARIRYYAYADPNHMPIKWKTFDFGFGDPRIVRKYGDFRNHRGTNPVNGASYCDGSSWGTTPEACEPTWFEEQANYLCEAEYRIGLPECGNGAYPCQGDDSGGDFCLFKPRVQFIDNWGVCNGDCPGEPGLGTVCYGWSECGYGAPLGVSNNYNALNKPWTEFRGEIKVYTTPPDDSSGLAGCGTV